MDLRRIETRHRLLMRITSASTAWYRCRSKTPTALSLLCSGRSPCAPTLPPIHGVERSIFPLEIPLGLAAGRATPALAERVAYAATDDTQSAVLSCLRVITPWPGRSPRSGAVIAATVGVMDPQLQAAQVAQPWLAEAADASRGRASPCWRGPGWACSLPDPGRRLYREAATAIALGL